MGTLTGCDDFQLNKTTWKKTQPVTAKGMDERVDLTVEDLIQKMEDGVEVPWEEYMRHHDVLSEEYIKARREGDLVRAGKLNDKRRKLFEDYWDGKLDTDRPCDTFAFRFCNAKLRLEEEENKIQKVAKKIKDEIKALSQKPDADPHVLQVARLVRNMTLKILEEKERLSLTHGVKEKYRDVRINLREITGMVQEKTQTLPEEVTQKLASLLSAFHILVARIWKLLFIVLLHHELKNLLASLKREGGYISSKKGRLKYGFEYGAMMVLYLSHDVESNPGPPNDKRGCMEWLVRQLSEALKHQLPVKRSLWSDEVADAVYAVGFPRKFYWNNPSGKNKLGNKDSMDTLVQKAKELGHMLTSMNCLPPELAPLLQDLSSEKGKEVLVVHCKIENLKTAVDALLNATLSPYQNKRVYQLVGKINKNCKEIEHHTSTRMASGSEFGQLADKSSNTGKSKCHLETDLLDGNLLSLMEARRSQEPMLTVQQPLDIQAQQTEQEQALDINTIAGDAGATGQIDNQFVLQQSVDFINENPTFGTVAAEDELPIVDLIDEFLSGSAGIPDPYITSTTDSCQPVEQHILSTEKDMIEEPPGNKNDQDSHEEDRLVGNTDQHTGSDLNNGQGFNGTVASVDEEGGACQTPALDNDSNIREIQARLLDEVKQHFEPDYKKYINKRLAELQAQSALSKFQATTHIQDATKKDDICHIQSAEEMNGEVLDDSTEGPVDNSAPTSRMGDEDATANSMRICEEDLERVDCTDDSVTSGKPSDTDTREDPPNESCHDDLAASTTTRNRKRKYINNRKQPTKRRRE